jgi:riboflavin biosynthesis pyrimidine reductase
MTLARSRAAVAKPQPAPRLGAPWPIEPLWQADAESSEHDARGGVLPPVLRPRFAASLSIPLRRDRPTIVANFVSTLDGVVALDRIGASGGREISGGFEPDRFVMGLLRATADAVLVGAGTVRASRTHGWTPAHAHPASGTGYAEWRSQLGLTTASPVTVIVSASGSLEAGDIPVDPATEVIVVTTDSGARRLRQLPRADHVEIVALGEGGSIPVRTVLEFLQARGLRLVLSEGGPSLFGELLAAGAVDEVFLTLAPQLAGRSEAAARLSLVEDVALAPAAPWGRIRSVMRSNDYLFLRYLLTHERREDLS